METKSDHAKQIVVVARARAQTGKEELLRQELNALLGPTRAEKPCIRYDLHESVDSPGEFLFYEIWESKAALDEHMAAPYMHAFFAKAPDLLAGEPDISIWNCCRA